ncbi:MAG: FkbM family methyltransferase, partial [Candidatus Binatia bacterium]
PDHRIYDPGDGRRPIDIEAVSLDDYFRGEAPVDFVKLDLQGSEPGALAGMSSLLSRPRPAKLLMELWPAGIRAAGHEPAEIVALLDARGFRFHRITAEGAEPISPEKLLRETPSEGINVFCLPAEER